MMQTPDHLEAKKKPIPLRTFAEMETDIRPRPDFFAIDSAAKAPETTTSERNENLARVEAEALEQDAEWRKQQHLEKLEDDRLRAIHGQLLINQLKQANDLEHWNLYLTNASRIHVIVQMYATHTGYPLAMLMSSRRQQPLVKARQMLFWILSEKMHRSFCHIGRLLGKDHSTVHHGVKKVSLNPEMLADAVRICDDIFTAEKLKFGPEAEG